MNNTGKSGDKGLPISTKGKKIGELESEELVFDEVTMAKIEQFRERFKSGDLTAVKELGDLLRFELGENTYDYTEKLLTQ